MSSRNQNGGVVVKVARRRSNRVFSVADKSRSYFEKQLNQKAISKLDNFDKVNQDFKLDSAFQDVSLQDNDMALKSIIKYHDLVDLILQPSPLQSTFTPLLLVPTFPQHTSEKDPKANFLELVRLSLGFKVCHIKLPHKLVNLSSRLYVWHPLSPNQTFKNDTAWTFHQVRKKETKTSKCFETDPSLGKVETPSRGVQTYWKSFMDIVSKLQAIPMLAIFPSPYFPTFVSDSVRLSLEVAGHSSVTRDWSKWIDQAFFHERVIFCFMVQ